MPRRLTANDLKEIYDEATTAYEMMEATGTTPDEDDSLDPRRIATHIAKAVDTRNSKSQTSLQTIRGHPRPHRTQEKRVHHDGQRPHRRSTRHLQSTIRGGMTTTPPPRR